MIGFCNLCENNTEVFPWCCYDHKHTITQEIFSCVEFTNHVSTDPTHGGHMLTFERSTSQTLVISLWCNAWSEPRYVSHFYMKTRNGCFESKHVVSWKQVLIFATSFWLLHTRLCRHYVLSGYNAHFSDACAPDHRKSYLLVISVPVCWKCCITSGQH